MKQLKHAKRAVKNAAILIEQARAADLATVVLEIEPRRERVERLIAEAERCADRCQQARDIRNAQHQVLADAYAESSAALDKAVKASEAAPYLPAAHVDVAERMRFRVARLAQSTDERLRQVAAVCQRAWAAYDTALFEYLRASAKARWLRDRALAESQLLRRRCERHKFAVLRALPAGSAAYRALKRIPMRTRPVQWLDDLVTDTGVPLRSWSS